MRKLTKYRNQLERKQAELRAAIRDRDDITIEQAADELDAVQLAALRDQAISDLDREFRMLREVNAALERFEDGSYGVCDECDEEISPRRLDALPWARHCVRCQDAIDRQGLAEAA